MKLNYAENFAWAYVFGMAMLSCWAMLVNSFGIKVFLALVGPWKL